MIDLLSPAAGVAIGLVILVAIKVGWRLAEWRMPPRQANLYGPNLPHG